MMLYRNTKLKVCSPNWDTDDFDIVAGVLHGDTLAPYLFIIYIDYVLRISIDKIKENSFTLTKERSRRYSAKTITYADYADNIVLLETAPPQAESLQHSLEQDAVKTHKMEYMHFNQTGDISTLNGSTQKLVDKFTCQGSSVSSTETDTDTWLAKAWTALDRLSIIWKSVLTNKMKHSFFQAAIISILLYGWAWTLTKRMEKKLDGNYTRMLRAILNKPWRKNPTKQQLQATYHPSRKLSKLDEPDMQDNAGEVGTRLYVKYSCGPLHLDKQRQDVQLEPTYSNPVSILDETLRTSQK